MENLDNSCKTDKSDNNNPNNTPLSPVLGLAKSTRRKIRKRKYPKSSINEPQKSQDEGPLLEVPFLDKMEQIKELDALESIRNETVNKISFSNNKYPITALQDNMQDSTTAVKIRSPNFNKASVYFSTPNNNLERIPTINVVKKHTVKNIFEGENFDDLKYCNLNRPTVSFQSAALNKLHNFEPASANTPPSFKVSSIEDNARFKTPNNLINNKKCFNNLNLEQTKRSPCFTAASFSSSNLVNIPSKKGTMKNIFDGENLDDLNLKETVSFQSASTLSKLQNFENLSANTTVSFNVLTYNSSTAKTARFKSPNLNKAEKLTDTTNNLPLKSTTKKKSNIFDENFDDLNMEQSVSFKSASNQDYDHIFNDFKLQQTADFNIEDNFRGFTQEEQDIGNSAVKLLENILKKRVNNKPEEINLNSSIITPIRTDFLRRPPKRKLGYSHSPSTLHSNEKSLKRAKTLFEKPLQTSTPYKFETTPSKMISPNLNSSFNSHTQTISEKNEKFCLNIPTNSNFDLILKDFAHYQKNLELELKVIVEKQLLLQRQNEEINSQKKRIISPGNLTILKSSNFNGIPLRNLTMDKTNSENNFLNEINPQNTHLFHFKFENNELCIRTSEGIILVPNLAHKIGLTEIENGFKSFKSVDAALLPQNWIRNHFKWIIWKLASYERNFTQLQGSLTLENVIKQLKYRYDTEIDNAKRPILRKILELDDTPQRRMILCVSNIIQVNNSHELELTDGWYKIRACIDQPLSQQVAKKKIKIGVKLIIYGAELKNCSGVHPLEVPEDVYLKIAANSTRISLWWSKLGRQLNPQPFCIPLESVNPNGGNASFRCYIVRVFPTKYLEKIEDKTRNSYKNVWRNERAQERIEIKPNSDIKAIMKLKISDALYDSKNRLFDFDIWSPNEEHFNNLKEGNFVTIFNATCSRRYILTAQRTTHYKKCVNGVVTEKLKNYQRKVTFIKNLSNFSVNDEFDTVGLVILKNIEQDHQEIWVCDVNKELLHITINNSQDQIRCLDRINESQIVGILNLTYRTFYQQRHEAFGDFSVIFTRYPQQKHLREAVEKLEKELSFTTKDLLKFVDECKIKINFIQFGNSYSYLDMDEDDIECSQITSTDIALMKSVEKLNILR